MSNTKTHKVDLPDKLYFKVGEVSTIADIPTYVLRFWETQFPRINPKRTSTGQRLYNKQDVELILTVKKLLYEDKFTIQGARKHLKSGNYGATAVSLADTLREIREELKEILEILDEA
jgi:DNA-binding transcriptional MerR regulator